MPEGDTIHRTASRLTPVLAGKTIASFEARRLVQAGPAPGVGIEEVEARGKYLLVHFADGTTLETHMKMSGSWHIYRRGERWRRSASAARAVIETDDGWVAVCFSAPHVKLIPAAGGAGRRSPTMTGATTGGMTGARPAAATDHLGPDLCRGDADLDEVVRRFSLRDPADPIAVTLLDQRIFCGVGNVFKSEVLFACGIHPSTPTGSIEEAPRHRLAATAKRMLRANLGPGRRTTTDAGPSDFGPSGGMALAVYGRRGQPCLQCGGPIEYGRHGRHNRSTYWCPACQPPVAVQAAPGPERGA